MGRGCGPLRRRGGRLRSARPSASHRSTLFAASLGVFVVAFGDPLIQVGGVGVAAARAGLDGTQRCGRHPGTRSPSSQCACFGEQTATGPGSSAYTSRTALLTKKESRPKHQPPGYQACMMRGEMWPRRQETFPRPDASPPRCAQLMGLASRGCLVLVLGATAERRNLFFRSDLGLPWIRALSLRLSR